MERLNLFTENSTMFGDEECFGDMLLGPGLNGGNGFQEKKVMRMKRQISIWFS